MKTVYPLQTKFAGGYKNKVCGGGIISSVACGFSPVKIDYSDYPKSFISRINEVYFFP